jgi:putative FmdB family regulatory protein
MPRYQYRCTACGEDLEVTQSFSDAALTECPACGGVLRKVFSPVGVVFKGSGFYRTDSRSSNGAAAKETNAPDGIPKESAGKESAGKESVGKDAGADTKSAPAKSGPASTPGGSSSSGNGRGSAPAAAPAAGAPAA